MDKLESKNKNINLLDVENYKKELNSETFHKCINIYINIGNHCVKYLLSNLSGSNLFRIFIIDVAAPPFP